MTVQAMLKEMLENAVHFGHKTSKWNPQMKKFIHSSRDGIHIIDLTLTAKKLEEAMQFLAKASSEGASILFVGTKPQSYEIIKETAKTCGAHYIIKKWVPGTLTNFSTIKTRIKRLKELKKENEENAFSKYTKKEKGDMMKEIETLEDAFGGVEDLKDQPKVLIVADAKRDVIALTEAKKLGIPTVAIVDTNADPKLVKYPVPGNDDAIKSLKYLFSKFEEAIMKGKKGSAKKGEDDKKTEEVAA
ncbi:MAG: 30S ribosomal protein S2 [Candidatus Peregrinibacteria bacterium]|nr:30S ribosomal protein S2 [Candidatus Peregrinibacteria bacterium]MDZ4245118.1 30S ribosomal protein S2 [Candidatus Gracilibacteria bacterium]